MMPSVYHLINSLLLSMAETWIFFWLCQTFLHPKALPRYLIRGAFLVYFLFQMVTYVLDFPLFSAWFFYCLFSLLIACLFYQDSNQIKVLVACLFVFLNYSCKLIASVLIMGLVHQKIPALPSNFVQGAASQMLACILFFLFTLLFVQFRKMHDSNKLTLYAIISYIYPFGILLISIHLFSVRDNTFLLYSDIAGILMCTTFFLFYLVDKTFIINEVRQKRIMADQLLSMQTDYYKQVEEAQTEITALRHDLKRHLHSLVSLLQMEQYGQALEYINGIYDSTNHLTVPVSSGNRMVNIMLSRTKLQAEEAHIAFTTNIMIPPTLPIENVDMCIILGNLLDNAVEACERITDDSIRKFINVEILFRKAFLVISITNSFNGEYHMSGTRYESTKTGETFCGIGLSNVSTVVEKYEGDMKISHEEHTFTVSIMLALEKEGIA